MKPYIHSLQESAMSNQKVGSEAGTLHGRGIGVMFLAFFGTWWMVAGLNGILGIKPALLVAVVGVALFAAGWRQSQREEREPDAGDAAQATVDAQRAKVFRNVNIAQWSGIVCLLGVLNLTHRVEWIMPGIMVIVGLHFFPLAKLFHNKSHYLTGTALVVLAASYPFVMAQGPSSAVGPIGAALILWLSAATTLLHAARR
jgi:hypothetical protein